MSPFPNSSKALLTISSLFASPGWQAVERERFGNMNIRFETHEKRASELLENMREALSLPSGSELWDSCAHQLLYFGETLDAYALHTAAFGADERQILWTLWRDLAPALGRTWGFWCQDEPIMPELPGGNLWFLPRVDTEHPERLVLPVAVITRWWRSQIKGPIEGIWRDAGDDRHRTLQTWLAGEATPSPHKLEEWFSDDQKFQYRAELTEPPRTRIVRTLLLWARVLETGWKTLVAGLTPNVAPDEPDPMRNKALQLAQLFRLAHQLTIAPQTKDAMTADCMFLAAVPDWLAREDFRSILPLHDGRLPASEACAAWMSATFMSMTPGASLQNIFSDAAMDKSAEMVVEPTIHAERQKLATRLEEGHAAWLSTARDRSAKVVEALARARGNTRSADMEADIEYLGALDALSRGDLDAARGMLDRGRELCANGNFGPVRLELARLSLALSVSREAFNQNKCEADFRVILRSIPSEEAQRWEIGRAPLEHSMRLASVEFSHWFWEGCLHPYPGVTIDCPLDERAPIFKGFARLLLSDADDVKMRAFFAEHKAILKRKLRDVRGDTFFTMTTKMVPNLVATMRAMSPFDGMQDSASDPSSADLAARMSATFLRFVRLLPTDVLAARDYRGQTALMLAANRKDAELMKILIEHRVDLDAQDTLGRSALHSAVRSDAIDCFDLLLNAGANPTLRTSEGKTAAIFAGEFGRAQIFQRRLAHRVRPISEAELREVRVIAARNEKDYKMFQHGYRMQGIELGGRSAFKEIIAASNPN